MLHVVIHDPLVSRMIACIQTAYFLVITFAKIILYDYGVTISGLRKTEKLRSVESVKENKTQ